MIRVLDGDMRDVVPTLDRIDAVVTDPPYHLTDIGRSIQHRLNGNGTDRTRQRNYAERGFMGKQWDGGSLAFDPDTWWPVFTALKPGGFLVAFGGTRTFHRMVCAIEDAGFEIRDTLMWLYGMGFPKSHNISVAIDKAAGAERHREVDPKGGAPSAIYAQDTWTAANAGTRLSDKPITPEAAQWSGWGTALKPAWEPIILARKPLEGTLAQNTLKHGVGGLNIDACRVAASEGDYDHPGNSGIEDRRNVFGKFAHGNQSAPSQAGRWPSNVMHDGSDEVLEAFAAYGERSSGSRAAGVYGVGGSDLVYGARGEAEMPGLNGSTGSAARFFYTSKADKADRADSRHPTVKPVDLMRWLVRLVCPPGGTVLDPFAGSGTTGEAAMLEGMNVILIEKDAQHAADIRHRIRRWSGEDCPLFAEVAD